MITLLAAIAFADPVVSRAAAPGTGAWVGLDGLGVSAQITDRVSVGVDLPWNAGSVAATATGRWDLTRGAQGWGVTATVGGGLVVPTAAPGIAVEITPAIQAGMFGRNGVFTVGVAAPISGGWVGAPVARLPALVEIQGGGRLGPMWLQGWVRMGAAWTPGLDTAILFDPGISLVWAGPLIKPRAADQALAATQQSGGHVREH